VEHLEERRLLSATMAFDVPSEGVTSAGEMPVGFSRLGTRPLLESPGLDNTALGSTTAANVVLNPVPEVGITLPPTTPPALDLPKASLNGGNGGVSGELSNRELAAAIHERVPAWSIDPTWVNSGTFSLSGFHDKWNPPSATPSSDGASFTDKETAAPTGTQQEIVVSHEPALDYPAVQHPAEVSPDAVTPASDPLAAESKSSSPTSQPEERSPGPWMSAAIVLHSGVNVAQSNTSLTMREPSLTEPGSGQNGERRHQSAHAPSGSSGLSAGAVTEEATGEGTTWDYQNMPLAVNDASDAETPLPTYAAVFAPQTAGLLTSLSATDLPLVDFGAVASQVTDLVRSLSKIDTNWLVASGVIVVVTAGIGVELVRRHYRQVTPQLICTVPGSAPPDLWWLG
jgi:hypothetical protein